MAKQWNVSRIEQDKFALQSQLKCEKAQADGHFINEIVPVTVHGKKGTITLIYD